MIESELEGLEKFAFQKFFWKVSVAWIQKMMNSLEEVQMLKEEVVSKGRASREWEG